MTFNDFINYLERNNYNWIAVDNIIFIEGVGSYYFDKDDETQLKELVSVIKVDSW